jgi:hypothetical protein
LTVRPFFFLAGIVRYPVEKIRTMRDEILVADLNRQRLRLVEQLDSDTAIWCAAIACLIARAVVALVSPVVTLIQLSLCWHYCYTDTAFFVLALLLH